MGPSDESPRLTVTMTRVDNGDACTESTHLTLQEDGSFALPQTYAGNPESPPYWHMCAPRAQSSDLYTAELLFELGATWLSSDERPSFDFLIHENEWENYIPKLKGGWDYPEVCLWFDWCVELYTGPSEIH